MTQPKNVPSDYSTIPPFYLLLKDLLLILIYDNPEWVKNIAKDKCVNPTDRTADSVFV
jgi:hypothetical protein